MLGTASDCQKSLVHSWLALVPCAVALPYLAVPKAEEEESSTLAPNYKVLLRRCVGSAPHSPILSERSVPKTGCWAGCLLPSESPQ